MAEKRLSDQQIARLSASIPARSVETIAVQYFGLSDAVIKNIKNDNLGDSEAQSREMFRRWAYKNPDNQVQTLAQLLYSSADEGNVNPHLVEEILKISVTKAKDVASTSRKRAHSTDKEPSSKKRMTAHDHALFVVNAYAGSSDTLGADDKVRVIESALISDTEELSSIVKEFKGSETARRKFTNEMEVLLSECVVDVGELRILGMRGFKVERRIIDAAVNNHPGNITEAAYTVIKAWNDEYVNKEEAYEVLCEALKKIKKNSWINKINEAENEG